MTTIPGLCEACDETVGRCADWVRRTGIACCTECTHESHER